MSISWMVGELMIEAAIILAAVAVAYWWLLVLMGAN